MHLEDGFSDESGAEEGPEGDEEVSAGDAGKVEQRVRDLKKVALMVSETFLFPPLSCVRGLLNRRRHPTCTPLQFFAP